MTMYLDATRLTFELESNEITRSRILINRDHIVAIEEAARGIYIATVNGSKYLVEATYEDAIEAVNKQERTEEIQEELLVKIKEEYQELNEVQEVAKFNQLFFDPSTLKIGMEGTASQEVFDIIKGKPPEQELREITMIAKIVDDQPANEAARPPRRTKRRIRRYGRWPR